MRLHHLNSLPAVPWLTLQVMFKTLNPQWNQTLEFPDDGSPLVLHVKDHNALLPTSNIGDCVVEYQRLPPNHMSNKWIPLQGVKRGEIHIQITRRVPELQKKSSVDSESSVTRAHQISGKVIYFFPGPYIFCVLTCVVIRGAQIRVHLTIFQ